MTYRAKHHDSCVRVLEFLKLLTKEDIDIKELEYDKKFKDIEAPETFLKYISTLEASEIDVRKIGKKYSLCKFPEEIEPDDKEIELIVTVCKAFDACCLEKERGFLEQFLSKLLKSLTLNSKQKLDLKLKSLKNSETNRKIAAIANDFQKYVDLAQKLKITYDGETSIVIPKRVEIYEDRVLLDVYNPKKAENYKFLTQNIEKIEILPIRVVPVNVTSSVVFEVYGRLIVNYRLRDGERVESFSDEKKVIINTGEDKKALIKRLMKYGENCKITSPKFLQQEMLDELEKVENKLKGVK